VTPEVRLRRFLALPALLALLLPLSLLPTRPAQAMGEGGYQRPQEFVSVAPAGSAPAADTDMWRLDDVYVTEWDCSKVIRDEYGAFGLQSVSVACDFASSDVSGNTQGTMTISYPDLMQGGQPATFAAQANGSMQWETNGSIREATARLRLTLSPESKYRNACKHEGIAEQEGGVTGAASLHVNRLTCTYDPVKDFLGANEVWIYFNVYPTVRWWVRTVTGGYYVSRGSQARVILIYKRCSDPNDCEPPQIRRPVLIIPGILGSYYYDPAEHQYWVLNRGVRPARVVIDPLTHAYDDLIQTLKNVGYVEGKDLFIAAYDWRLTPGPVDGTFDGHLAGLTGASITDTTYEYGVDYLGFWLRQAAEAWQRDHPGRTLDSVDVISHSTGGLVARSYIQSGAYGDTFVSQGQTMRLPRINNLIMVAVPNRGAAQPWQAMNNNFIIDASSKYVISKMLNIAYQKVQQGQTITGFPAPITPDSIRFESGSFDGIAFINQYVPTFRSLLATYDFYIGQDGKLTNLNMEPMYRNDLLLDLNNGLDMPGRPPPADPSPFAPHVKTTVIYSDNQYTAYRVQEEVGPASKVLFRLDNYKEQDVPKDYIYYRDIGAVLGDGTVPRESLVGQCEGDTRVSRVRVLSGDTTHSGLMANPLVQQKILDTLGAAWLASDISTGLARKSLINLWNVTSDPVEMFLVDGSGRRLGYSQSTGPVTELPNSAWYGDADGLGWVFGALQEPLSVTLTGLGEDYYALVAGQQAGMAGGMAASGSLAQGENKTLEVETEPWGGKLYLPALLRYN